MDGADLGPLGQRSTEASPARKPRPKSGMLSA